MRWRGHCFRALSVPCASMFLMPTLTAFVPGVFSFPGSAWERQGRAALPLQEQPQAEPAKQGVPEQSPGTRMKQSSHLGLDKGLRAPCLLCGKRH
jgi:hypothetical protein